MNILPLPLVRDPSVPEGARAVGIAAIVSGVLGLLVLPLIFGPIAIVLGVVAVAQRHRAAWWGIALGAFQVIALVSAVYG
jgi:hypothetical protein